MVSADSLQVYRELNIGTAKPDRETLRKLPHHLIDIHDFTHSFNVGEFSHRADTAVRDILSRGFLPVISGGTAYYMRSWLLGLPESPPADPAVRRAVNRRWTGENDNALRRELERVDPASAGRIGGRDRYRMLRALEIYEQTGRPLSDFPPPVAIRRDYQVLSLGLRRNRDDLCRRIERRVDSMLHAGLAREVARLRAAGARLEDPGMKGIGYREWFGTPENPDPPFREVRETIIRNTRRYAKRQMTFFSSLPDVRWLDLTPDVDSSALFGKILRDFLA